MPRVQKKERLLKDIREICQVTYNGKPIRIIADISSETLKSDRAWNDIFQALKVNS
jgi:hypothetical protein